MTIRRTRRRVIALAAVSAGAVAVTPAFAASGTFLGPLHKKHKVASTVPANGDVNPYGIAVAPTTTGSSPATC
jgi:ABC-type sugar transport system substrate-binding protein